MPVIHGDVLFGAAAGNAKTTDGRIWNATIKVSGAGDYGKISSQLKGAGFAVDTEPDPGDAEEARARSSRIPTRCSSSSPKPTTRPAGSRITRSPSRRDPGDRLGRHGC
ncbi:hypothetical protein GCM10025881_31040 [Pseudolysinimonas kribbensis]|uniref:LytR/CpsA/Psr regulator C-terminal domain-containing protein n=1 Tax=Pseudolysinimonas kribbensis TaxID=433641 RepID=A0ABQ6KBT1_9MICO|nr:hypothetical protein [Pseudolysinimonas kribbensis]GMA96280.1 hypothetical protein GCM10025881_31040 [Pseudolysinimonas kribbensis]